MWTLDPNNPATLTTGAIEAAQTALDGLLNSSSAMTLAQAISLKSGFVDGIYNGKRQMPISYTVSAGTFLWDATDAAVSALTLAVLIAALANAAAMQTLINSIITQANAALAYLTTNTIDNDLGIGFGANTVGTPAEVYNGNTNAPVASADVPAANIYSIGGSPAAGVIVQFSAPDITGTAGGLGTVSWTPLGNVSPVTLTGAEVSGLLAAIAARTASLQQTHLSYFAALAALGSVAEVSGYDVTADWSY
jgi:hypothetical protein